VTARRAIGAGVLALLLLAAVTVPASAAGLATGTPPQPVRPILYAVYLLALAAAAGVVVWAVLGGRRDATSDDDGEEQA